MLHKEVVFTVHKLIFLDLYQKWSQSTERRLLAVFHAMIINCFHVISDPEMNTEMGGGECTSAVWCQKLFLYTSDGKVKITLTIYW